MRFNAFHTSVFHTSAFRTSAIEANAFQTNRTIEDERGFGLIEVVVSMLLFALVSVAVVPVLVNALRLSFTTATLTTATQVLNEQIEEARSQDATCAALTSFVAETIAPVVDRRGVSLQATRGLATCPTSYPGTVAVDISVAVSGSSVPLASTVSLIFVGAES